MELVGFLKIGNTLLDRSEPFVDGIAAEDAFAVECLPDVVHTLADTIEVLVGRLTKRPEFLAKLTKNTQSLVFGVSHKSSCRWQYRPLP